MIYDVTLYGHITYRVSIEAKDSEDAEIRAEKLLTESIGDDVDYEVNDGVATKSDNQYTDSQELEDGERRYEDK